MPVCACEDNKGEEQPKKDGHEDEICPEGADEIYEAQEAHKEEEEACMITSQYESRDSNAGAVLPKLAWNPGLLIPCAGWFGSAA